MDNLKKLQNPGVKITTGGFVLEKKAKIELSLISSRLVKLGYSNVGESVPSQVGEFSYRGGVLDLWLERYRKPVRIDLYAEKIENIYLFDPKTSIKVKDLKEVYIAPFKSLPPRPETWPKSIKGKTNKYERLFLSEIEPGNYVVHIDHGVGRFVGLEKKTPLVGEAVNLIIEYAKGDRLYVPINQIERVTKYVGSPGHRPTLNYLGTLSWERTKKRVTKSVVNLARELLQLYAVRETISRPPYLTDSPWQRELSDSFLYPDTEDQIRVIREIKEDFKKKTPMDRLLVGDVGFGKTEVALRAAFAAVENGKQVAVLTPTTLLAEQHYHVFKERLKKFPVTLEFLSRFTDKKRGKRITEEIKGGLLDIVIGTHRILAKDIEFKRLGMLIIDEEHRFGVGQKEELKKKRLEADILSLSATPIPRTLHLSLAKLRDISMLNTPPGGRLAIKTKLTHFDWPLIKAAIEKETARGGQIYFVYNWIIALPGLAYRIRELLPKVTVAYAHGQMENWELEETMNNFYEGKIDCLVCTTIIGSGIDMPNVNTIFINDAHMYGLADLHQLRGRVGRSDRQAYAYLLIPKEYVPQGASFERLTTITEETELGAGFKIASRDLEIRGAGNILGSQQHGFINIVGFELYLRLLSDAINNIRAGKSLKRL